MEEKKSLRERAGLSAGSMLPPLPAGARKRYIIATVAALLLSLLSFTPLF